jgi:hypothetical protein
MNSVIRIRSWTDVVGLSKQYYQHDDNVEPDFNLVRPFWSDIGFILSYQSSDTYLKVIDGPILRRESNSWLSPLLCFGQASLPSTGGACHRVSCLASQVIEAVRLRRSSFYSLLYWRDCVKPALSHRALHRFKLDSEMDSNHQNSVCPGDSVQLSL